MLKEMMGRKSMWRRGMGGCWKIISMINMILISITSIRIIKSQVKN